MTIRPMWIAAVLALTQMCALGQQTDSTALRNMNLQEAVELALKHNHVVRIASMKIEEDEHAKEVAKSGYFPILRNDTVVTHATDTQFIGLPAGSLGVVAGDAIPPKTLIVNQGDRNFVLSSTGLTQPL